MDLAVLERFLFWCLVINAGIYTFSAIAALVMRRFICAVHKKMFDLDEATTLQVVQKYLATYKLLITVFNFTPWIAILIIR